MRVELPRDQFAEMRDIADLKGGDAKAIRRATKFKVHDGALEEISMGIGDDQMDALLARIITSWDVRPASGGEPLALPMFDPAVLDDVPLDTYNALVDAATPHKDAIDKTGKSTKTSETASTTGSSPAILQGSVSE
jgi:hypothetical protein